MSVNNAESRNYWLGGFWKNGSVRGVIWRRGRWYNGTWLKGQWYSNDLEIQWVNNDPNKNKWSVWYGGIWKSNSREKYDLDNLDLDSEYSVWHGGIWKCALHENASYSWQGENPLSRINIYGNIDTFTTLFVVSSIVNIECLPYINEYFGSELEKIKYSFSLYK
jgi:hypothetical protein